MTSWVESVISFYAYVSVFAITWALARKVFYAIMGAVTNGEINF